MTAVAITDAAATAVATSSGTPRSIAINNPAGGSTVYLDVAATVTSTTGYPLDPGDDLTARIGAAETMYARCGTGGSATVRVLVMGS